MIQLCCPFLKRELHHCAICATALETFVPFDKMQMGQAVGATPSAPGAPLPCLHSWDSAASKQLASAWAAHRVLAPLPKHGGERADENPMGPTVAWVFKLL